jgi:hypothetical protein
VKLGHVAGAIALTANGKTIAIAATHDRRQRSLIDVSLRVAGLAIRSILSDGRTARRRLSRDKRAASR